MLKTVAFGPSCLLSPLWTWVNTGLDVFKALQRSAE